jgi:hypothetical protein
MNNSNNISNKETSSSSLKAIKISPENRAAIEKALHVVNGRASQHCFDRYSEIIEVVDQAEQWLTDKLPKKLWRGTQYEQQSGRVLAKAYKYAASTTTIRIERRASGWFLRGITPSMLWPDSHPAENVYLTKAQSDEFLRRVQTQDEVIREEQPVAQVA